MPKAPTPGADAACQLIFSVTIAGMLTKPAARSLPEMLENAYYTVVRAADLLGWGWTPTAIRAQLHARRWQRAGRAIVLHNGALQPDEQRHVVLLNCGPRAVLTAFTAATDLGLVGWERDEIHVLVPAGVRLSRQRNIAVRMHYTGDWAAARTMPARRLHQIAPALLLAAVGDIAQGAEALSEINFARLCRRLKLPTPSRQAVRVEPSGRRRYLDAEWTRRDGRRLAAEVDGACM